MIVVVGGSAEDGQWIEDALRPSGLPVSVRPLADVLAFRRPRPGSPRPEVLILHERRRREDLLDSLDRLHAHPTLGRVPLVVIDHERDIERFTAAVARGAAACLCPPLDPAHLRATVSRLARWREGEGTAERRRRRRRPLLLRVDVLLPGGRALEGLMRDVSATGCRLETSERVAPRTEVSITPYGYDASLEFRIGAVVRRQLEVERGLHMLACRFVGTGAVMAPRLFAVKAPAGKAEAQRG